MFVGHAFVQHAGARWNGYHALSYHTYVIPEKNDLKDVVKFTYGTSSGRTARLLEPDAN